MSERKVTLAQLAAGVELAAGEEHKLTVVVHDRAEIEDAFFHHDSTFFLPDAPEPAEPSDSSATDTPFANTALWDSLTSAHPKFTNDVKQPYDPDGEGAPSRWRDGVPMILAVLKYAESRPNRKLLITGHTDTVGDAAYNEKLSGLRAASVAALVEGDRAAFVEAVKDKHGDKDNTVMLRYVARTRGWPCDVPEGQSAGYQQISAFQQKYNDVFGAAGKEKLSVDGAVGPKTLGGYFDVMEDDLALQAGGASALASLRGKVKFVDPDHKTLACGERFPIDEEGIDEFASQTNRRVEVLGFDPSDLPDLSTPDAAERIYAKDLHFLRPMSLQGGTLAARSGQEGERSFKIDPAQAPPAGVGEPEEELATEMTLRDDATDAEDAWAFLEPLDESRSEAALARAADASDDTALA